MLTTDLFGFRIIGHPDVLMGHHACWTEDGAEVSTFASVLQQMSQLCPPPKPEVRRNHGKAVAPFDVRYYFSVSKWPKTGNYPHACNRKRPAAGNLFVQSTGT